MLRPRLELMHAWSFFPSWIGSPPAAGESVMQPFGEKFAVQHLFGWKLPCPRSILYALSEQLWRFRGATRRNLPRARSYLPQMSLQSRNCSEIIFWLLKLTLQNGARIAPPDLATAPRRHLFYCKHEIMQEVISHSQFCRRSKTNSVRSVNSTWRGVLNASIWGTSRKILRSPFWILFIRSF